MANREGTWEQLAAELAELRQRLGDSDPAEVVRLAARIALEMNNPLTIVSTRIELMLVEAESRRLPAETVEDLTVALRNVQRVAQIAQALGAFGG
jgi:signal transduction histidine kinase